MNALPADAATDKALELVASVHRLPFAASLNEIAVALRNAEAKGYAAGLTKPRAVPGSLMEIALTRTPQDEANFREYCAGIGRRARPDHTAPREWRDHERRAVRDSLFEDCQRDHDDSVLAGHPGFAGNGA